MFNEIINNAGPGRSLKQVALFEMMEKKKRKLLEITVNMCGHNTAWPIKHLLRYDLCDTADVREIKH